MNCQDVCGLRLNMSIGESIPNITTGGSSILSNLVEKRPMGGFGNNTYIGLGCPGLKNL